jgi:NAD(P)-dependent dehydrogenase (short-subunit alcohol dehydrogenase family)
MDRLIASAKASGVPSRVINVASIAHTRGAIDAGDPSWSNGFTGYGAYARGKLANVMHAMTLAEKHDPKELVAYSLHPGVVATKLLRQGFGPVQGTSVGMGAKHVVRLAAEEGAPAAPSGTYFNESTATQPSTSARDAHQREALWQLSLSLARV